MISEMCISFPGPFLDTELIFPTPNYGSADIGMVRLRSRGFFRCKADDRNRWKESEKGGHATLSKWQTVRDHFVGLSGKTANHENHRAVHETVCLLQQSVLFDDDFLIPNACHPLNGLSASVLICFSHCFEIATNAVNLIQVDERIVLISVGFFFFCVCVCENKVNDCGERKRCVCIKLFCPFFF